MEKYLSALKSCLDAHPPEVESILALLYEAYEEAHPMDDETIRADFEGLYQQMNGMTIREMDRVVYPVCTLCRDHERSGFSHGVRVGFRLATELQE